jgi:hypothetical protein
MAWEQFNLFTQWVNNFIRVSNGNYLSLVNGALRTNGTYIPANTGAFWQESSFLFYKCGDPGSDAYYHISSR